MKKIIFITLVLSMILSIAGCHRVEDDPAPPPTINYKIEDVDLYAKLPEIDSQKYVYDFLEVYQDKMFVVQYELLRNSYNEVNDLETVALYQYDIANDKVQPYDLTSLDLDNSFKEKLLNIVEINDGLYFYIISKADQNSESLQTLYYLDKGDRSNEIFRSSNSSKSYTPQVVIQDDEIYFVVCDTNEKDREAGRGYDKFSDLQIIKLNEEAQTENIFISKEDLFGFAFEYSSPISFLTVNGDDEMTIYAFEDDQIQAYPTGDDFDGYDAFGGNIYGIHDNWGQDDRELYWYDVKNDVKLPMTRRAEEHTSLGDYVIVIDNTGTTVMAIKEGQLVSVDIDEGLKSPLYAIKIDDHSAFIACTDFIFKKITFD